MRTVHLLVIIGLLLGVTACQSKEAEQFISQDSTVEEAHRLVEEAMRQKGLTVSAGDIPYAHHGKSIDTGRVVVDYETKHEPIYRGRAFLNVDEESKPRRFVGVDHLGLDYTEGLLALGDVLMERIATIAYQSVVLEVEPVMEQLPELSWENDEKIDVNRVDYDKKQFPEILRLYGENRLGNPTEAEAQQWLEQYQIRSDDEPLELWLSFNYAREMTNAHFEAIMEQFSGLEDTWDGPMYVRITADHFDETEDPIYNAYSNGMGSNVFIGVFE